MSRSHTEVSAVRVGSACAVLLVVAAGVHASVGSDPRDEASYRAGYRVASNGTVIRRAMTTADATPVALCTLLLDRALSTDPPPHIVRTDFISGCTRGVAEAME